MCTKMVGLICVMKWHYCIHGPHRLDTIGAVCTGVVGGAHTGPTLLSVLCIYSYIHTYNVQSVYMYIHV